MAALREIEEDEAMTTDANELIMRIRKELAAEEAAARVQRWLRAALVLGIAALAGVIWLVGRILG